MDPNANLQAQERILATLADPRVSVGSAALRDALAELRDLRADLRGWLWSGGVAPDWSAAPLAAPSFRESAR